MLTSLIDQLNVSLPEYWMISERDPDVREPEERFVVTEEEVVGGDVLNAGAVVEELLHVLKE